MAARGFDFVVAVAPLSQAAAERSELYDQDWIAKYGYGISTSIEDFLAIQFEDPNVNHVATLDPQEQQLYMTVLLGEKLASGEVTDPSQVPPLDEQGCSGEGVEATGGLAITEDLTTFNTAYADARERLMSDPEVASAVAEWSDCMAELGYTFSDPDSPSAYVTQQAQVILQPLQAAREDMSSDEFESLLADSANADLGSVPGLDLDALFALQDEERSIASADYECYEQHVATVYEPLLYAQEEGLLDEYGDALTRARDLISD